MSQLKLIKASAGSGKTFRIAGEFLFLLLKYPENYRRILGVTFTNKATEEMKGRILDELYKVAQQKPSKHLALLIQRLNKPEDELIANANKALNSILHNYSRFSVSTIDSFFQRIIKSFARETGVQFNFLIETDAVAILEKSSDEMLEMLGSNKLLLEWLTNYAEQRIEEGKSWNFREAIVNMGKQLFNENFKLFPPSYHQKIADKNWLGDYYQKLDNIKIDFENKTKKIAEEAYLIMNRNGLTAESFKYGNSGGVGAFFTKLRSEKLVDASNRLRGMQHDAETWITKGSQNQDAIINAANEGLLRLLSEAIEFIDNNKDVYFSSKVVLSNFFTLGLMSDLSASVSDYLSNNNIFLMANASVFLKTIIGENDVPFIYEKTGQTYHHYMIDEFQDTSIVQWANFKPLVANSLSANNLGMLVGDIKQSIYRFRNTDWKVMAYAVNDDLKTFGIHDETLQYNYRSKKNIIAFNNTIFDLAAHQLQDIFNKELETRSTIGKNDEMVMSLISSAYKDCMQKINTEHTYTGSVKAKFYDKVIDDEILEQTVIEINNLLTFGYALRDIAILVRTANEGRLIMDYINRYNQSQTETGKIIHVLSNESALLAKCIAIQFITSLMKYIINPEDEINKFKLAKDWHSITSERNQLNESGLFDVINLENPLKAMPAGFENMISAFRLLTPDELFERAVDFFKLNEIKSYLPYLQSFHDFIITFKTGKSKHLSAFIDAWNEKQHKLSLTISESQDAVKIITVHKSKGLEFNNVIIPFCTWKIDGKSDNSSFIWTHSNTEPFSMLEHIPIKYSQKLKDTIFSDDYYLEKCQSYLDNLNLLYVAFTRAIDNLIFFGEKPGKEGKVSDVGMLLYRVMTSNGRLENNDYPTVQFDKYYKNESSEFEFGQLTPYVSQNTEIKPTELKLEKYPVNLIDERLKQHSSIKSFWDNIPQHLGQKRLGNLMHYIFQNIKTYNDIDTSIDKLVLEGYISKHETEYYSKTIKKLLEKEPFQNWYSNEWKVFNEAAIIVPNEHLYRPDRVMVKDQIAIVLDYKFGQKEQITHTTQVKNYMSHLKAMEYKNVEGYLWYVGLDRLVRVE
jgi:ATP-dependent exoDNAse (exonuclease V) beta subunit